MVLSQTRKMRVGRKTVKAVVKRKPQTTVKKLARDVSKLKAVAMNRINYFGGQQFECSTVAGTASYNATPLMKFNNWTRIFGTDADDESNKQCLIRKLAGQWTITTNEPDNRSYSMFVVSLKDEASELLNADGTLAALTAGTHYSLGFGQGSNCLLNLKLFNIHYHKRFMLGVVPQVKSAVAPAGAVQNIGTSTSSTQRFGKFNLRLGRGLFIKNPVQDWKAGVHPKDPSKNYYVLTFWSGDSNVDLEVPTMSVHWVAGVDVSA